MAIQPLDLLPPVDVTFRDYALAVCRSQQLADPLDPRGLLRHADQGLPQARRSSSDDDVKRLNEPHYLTERLALSVPHSIDDISRSRAAAYRFLDDNREDLLIPASRDFFVADLYDAKKRGRQNLPSAAADRPAICLARGGAAERPRSSATFAGRTTTMLCGGTLVFNDNGNVLSWTMKPGSQPYGGKRAATRQGRGRSGRRPSTKARARRTAFLETARRADRRRPRRARSSGRRRA